MFSLFCGQLTLLFCYESVSFALIFIGLQCNSQAITVYLQQHLTLTDDTHLLSEITIGSWALRL